MYVTVNADSRGMEAEERAGGVKKGGDIKLSTHLLSTHSLSFRLVCLRVHPSFKVATYELALVKLTSISGEAREIVPKPGDIMLTADD